MGFFYSLAFWPESPKIRPPSLKAAKVGPYVSGLLIPPGPQIERGL